MSMGSSGTQCVDVSVGEYSLASLVVFLSVAKSNNESVVVLWSFTLWCGETSYFDKQLM